MASLRPMVAAREGEKTRLRSGGSEDMGPRDIGCWGRAHCTCRARVSPAPGLVPWADPQRGKGMVKARVQYVCSDCGAEFSKWHGQCHDCGAWNTIAELRIPVSSRRDGGRRGYAGVVDAEVQRLSEVSTSQQPRISTGTGELDRVLGGGLVAGSVTLLGGQPGAGKSTLLLQTLRSEEHTTEVQSRGHDLCPLL